MFTDGATSSEIKSPAKVLITIGLSNRKHENINQTNKKNDIIILHRGYTRLCSHLKPTARFQICSPAELKNSRAKSIGTSHRSQHSSCHCLFQLHTQQACLAIKSILNHEQERFLASSTFADQDLGLLFLCDRSGLALVEAIRCTINSKHLDPSEGNPLGIFIFASI